MTRTRLIVLGALLAFTAAVAALSFTSWTWHSELQTPVGVAASDVAVSCGSPWGSPSAHTPSTTLYVPLGRPCEQRTDYSIMGGADVFLAVVGLVAFARWVRRHPADDSEQAAPQV